jgi:hypothetical protein
MNQRESRKRVEIKTGVKGTEIDAQGMIESEIETEVIETVRTIEAMIARGDDYFHLTFFAHMLCFIMMRVCSQSDSKPFLNMIGNVLFVI